MTQRHPIQNDALMFITTNTRNRRKIFLHDPYACEAIDRLYRVQNLHPFLLFGFVIMPDHVHLLVNIRSPYSIGSMMNSFKTGLTFDIGIGPLWQRRFYMRIPDNGYKTLEYIHQNPVKAGIVEKPENYPWSSASGRYDVSILPMY